MYDFAVRVARKSARPRRFKFRLFGSAQRFACKNLKTGGRIFRKQVIFILFRENAAFDFGFIACVFGIGDDFERTFGRVDSARNFDGFDDVADNCVARRAVQFGFGAQRETMTQNRQRHVAHVVRRRKIATANRRQRF